MKNKNPLLIIFIIGAILISYLVLKPIWEQSKNLHKENTSNIENNKVLATKKFIMKTFNVTEEELSGINIDKVIAFNEMTEDTFMEIKQEIKGTSTIRDHLLLLQKDMENCKNIEISDYSYLFDADEFKGEKPEMSTIHYLSVSQQIGDGGRSCVIDFEKNMIYSSVRVASVYEDLDYADQLCRLTKEKKEEILNALTNADIQLWDYKYVSNSKEDVKENLWQFGVEYKNGIVTSNIGYGKQPDTYAYLEKVLFPNKY